MAERAEFAAIVNRLVDIWVEIANFTHTSQSFLQQKLHPFQVFLTALIVFIFTDITMRAAVEPHRRCGKGVQNVGATSR